MKFLALLLLTISSAFAGETVIFQAKLSSLPSYDLMDTLYNFEHAPQVRAWVVMEDQDMSDHPSYDRVFSEFFPIEGLSLENDKLIYRGSEGEILCGEMGVGRIIRRPHMILNGRCVLTSRYAGDDLQIIFITR